MDWKAELFKRLDALAEKLGVAAQFLWGVLVKQAYIQGYVDLLEGTFAGVFAYLVCKALFKYVRRQEDFWDMPGPFFACLFGGLATAGLILISWNDVGAGILHIFNPSYYALQEILNSVK